ncbi:glutamyl-tRNA reductase [Thiomicrorhabdus immobilis]|uniref:Glutamyl-tRNA reductase n=1 Tax=Thiomicrorhabdus immobilis TaxID=2791037 RepID=A0ABN6CUJ1_9GAMM|nr:glutamyl-tRNA reductase [Thiomicrorhabdus immobilis]BCN92656.1 glutamyl-tRNA reductase [Thiomicrorhabdus immobilis]
MKLCTLGVNHETAPVDIRETVSFSADSACQAIEQLKSQALVSECVILSTCNRTELYCILKENHLETQVHEWLHQFFNLEPKSLMPYLYSHRDLDAVKHIMRVASGLNSLVLGEPQIFGQIKDAYNAAHKTESIHQNLENLFQHIFKTVKQVRTDTAIGNSPISVAFSAVSLSKQFFGDLSQQTALLLGAGETIELVARHLKENHIGNLIIANRTFERAHRLAESVAGYAIQLDEIDNHLHEADIVIGSTGSPNAILMKNSVVAALKKRKNRPMFMVDIAVPRDIEPKIGDLNDVYLYTVDDLQEIIETSKQSRQSAALEAEEIIELQAQHFITQMQATQQIKPVIQAYRQQSMHIKEAALEHALHQLEQGVNSEEIIKRLANQLTNRLIHTPTKQLNQAGMNGDTALIEAAETLLICEEHSKPSHK